MNEETFKKEFGGFACLKHSHIKQTPCPYCDNKDRKKDVCEYCGELAILHKHDCGGNDNSEAVSYSRYKALLDQIEAKDKELEQHKAITEAAKFLVEVKRHKDTQPAQYQALMPMAWRNLEEAVAGLTA